MKFLKRQKKDNIELDEVYRLLKGYYRCSVDEGYPFLFLSDDFLNTLHWTQKEIETEFDNKLVNMLHPEDKICLDKNRDLLKDINDNLNMYINDHLRMYTSDYALI